MTPAEVIAKNLKTINGIRIPFVRILTERILSDLKDEGFSIVETSLLDSTFFKTKEKPNV